MVEREKCPHCHGDLEMSSRLVLGEVDESGQREPDKLQWAIGCRNPDCPGVEVEMAKARDPRLG